MKNYPCPICNKKHPVYRGMEMPPPAVITNIPKAEQPHRLRQHKAFFFVDERQLFINAYLHLFLEGQSKPFFSWSLWGELSTSEYHILQPMLATGNSVKFRGKLPPPSLLYPEGDDLSCDVLVFPGTDREPEIIVLTPGELQNDQASPITSARVKTLMTRVHHYPEDQLADDAPFTERFRAVLAKAHRLYLDEGKNFCITLYGTRASTLQVLSSAVLENADASTQGYGIHLPLDDHFPSDDIAKARIRALNSGKEFDCLELDDVLTFQADLGFDVDRLDTTVQEVIAEILEEEVADFSFDLFEI